MKKLLIQETEKQFVLQLDNTGAYLGAGIILWDESVDGPLDPTLTVGGIVRQGSQLVMDQVKLAAAVAAEQAEQADIQQKRLDKATRRSALAQIDNITTIAQMRVALKAVVKEVFDID